MKLLRRQAEGKKKQMKMYGTSGTAPLTQSPDFPGSADPTPLMTSTKDLPPHSTPFPLLSLLTTSLPIASPLFSSHILLSPSSLITTLEPYTPSKVQPHSHQHSAAYLPHTSTLKTTNSSLCPHSSSLSADLFTELV
ncbi:hypothetical protein E2C01_060054 [Portunus trituberculatus]|uniref:Uncharacterized protein n=1 Tax=Portunus trituberculatus TaxID=210409 RepID=A0A5B7H7P2_PORTR|nr:hypothetical protein [Portunus trituberculatus]